MNEPVLIFGLDHPSSVLSHCGHHAKDVCLWVSLEDALDTNVNGNEDSSPTNASRAVHQCRS